MKFRGGVASASVALALSMLTCATLAATEAEPIQASWKEQEINFVYIARTSFYACRSIEDKIEWVLEQLGARKDLVVRSFSCMGQAVGDTFTNVKIKVAVPVAGSPGAGLEPGEKARRELVARVRGEPSTDVDAAEQFPAAWTTVKFSRRSRYVDDGDCELLEQLAAHVFPKLGVQVVREKNWCIPGQVQLGQLDLEVEALKAQPQADDAK